MENSDQKPAASGAGRRLGLRILGLFVLSAWMFGLGVWVGRGTAPLRFDIAKLETELAEMTARLLQEEQQRTTIAQEAAGDWANLDFYEALKKSGDDPLPDPEGPRDTGGTAADRSETAKPKKSLKAATRTAAAPPHHLLPDDPCGRVPRLLQPAPGPERRSGADPGPPVFGAGGSESHPQRVEPAGGFRPRKHVTGADGKQRPKAGRLRGRPQAGP